MQGIMQVSPEMLHRAIIRRMDIHPCFPCGCGRFARESCGAVDLHGSIICRSNSQAICSRMRKNRNLKFSLSPRLSHDSYNHRNRFGWAFRQSTTTAIGGKAQDPQTEFAHQSGVTVYALDSKPEPWYELIDRYPNLFKDRGQVNGTEGQEMEIPLIPNWQDTYKAVTARVYASGHASRKAHPFPVLNTIKLFNFLF